VEQLPINILIFNPTLDFAVFYFEGKNTNVGTINPILIFMKKKDIFSKLQGNIFYRGKKK